MSAEYTPTTDEVRAAYVRTCRFNGYEPAVAAVEFDAWLAKIKAAAWDADGWTKPAQPDRAGNVTFRRGGVS